jgi:hypothetical protein
LYLSSSSYLALHHSYLLDSPKQSFVVTTTPSTNLILLTKLRRTIMALKGTALGVMDSPVKLTGMDEALLI